MTSGLEKGGWKR
jgi:hypothetical protein